jgi:hypothetical protein
VLNLAADRKDVFWRLYLLSAMSIGVTIDDSAIRKAVERIQVLRQRQSARQAELISELIQDLNAPQFDVRIHRAWCQLDASLTQDNHACLLCLDGLDAAFKTDTRLREEALVGLLVGWQATFASLQRVNVKVFLRADIWQRLSFAEKSHLRGREMRLAWENRDLWRLVVKRILNAQPFKEWCEQSLPGPILTEQAVETAGERTLWPFLNRLFEHKIWAGKNSLSRNWILRRLSDAKGTIFPRDLIGLMKESIGIERGRITDERRTSDESVISRESLSLALEPTSKNRIEDLKEEYSDLQSALDRLVGLDATGDFDVLKQRLSDDVVVKTLIEAGVIEQDEEKYRFPEIYRLGLQMRRPGPK